MTATFNFLNERLLQRLQISVDIHAESNYSRNKVEKTHKGTCPCCLMSFCVKNNGRLVRHGWKETGRRKGQYGQGFQWGECWGTDLIPLEQSDVDGLKIARELEAQLIQIQNRIDFLAAGKQEIFHVPFGMVPVMVRDERGGFNIRGGEDNFEISNNNLNMIKDFLLNEGIDYEVEIVTDQPTRSSEYNREYQRKCYAATAHIYIKVDKHVDQDLTVRTIQDRILSVSMEPGNTSCYETKRIAVGEEWEVLTQKERLHGQAAFHVGTVQSWETCNDKELADMQKLRTDTMIRMRQLIKKIQWHYDNSTSGVLRK